MPLSTFLSFLLNELKLLRFLMNKDRTILVRSSVVDPVVVSFFDSNKKIELQQRKCLKPTVFCKRRLLFWTGLNFIFYFRKSSSATTLFCENSQQLIKKLLTIFATRYLLHILGYCNTILNGVLSSFLSRSSRTQTSFSKVFSVHLLSLHFSCTLQFSLGLNKLS